MKCEDISWVGIKIDGTNVIVSTQLADLKPEIIDVSTPCDIVSDKEAVITKITTLNGTALVEVGDTVNVGDTLVRGIIEGKYTEAREVHAEAEIFAKVWYTKEAEESLVQSQFEMTSNTYNNFAIKINNFKINFNKRLPNFKKYDTIEANKKIKIFSNLYMPIEFIKTTYIEKNLKQKVYTTEELSDELQKKLKKELLEENDILEENLIDVILTSNPTEDGVEVKVTCVTEEKIGIEQQSVY
jgi:similar to stage IV sporulation protein